MKKLYFFILLAVISCFPFSTVHSDGERVIVEKDNHFANISVDKKNANKLLNPTLESKVFTDLSGMSQKEYPIVFVPAQQIDNGIFLGPVPLKEDIIVGLPEGDKVIPVKNEKDVK